MAQVVLRQPQKCCHQSPSKFSAIFACAPCNEDLWMSECRILVANTGHNFFIHHDRRNSRNLGINFKYTKKVRPIQNPLNDLALYVVQSPLTKLIPCRWATACWSAWDCREENEAAGSRPSPTTDPCVSPRRDLWQKKPEKIISNIDGTYTPVNFSGPEFIFAKIWEFLKKSSGS